MIFSSVGASEERGGARRWLEQCASLSEASASCVAVCVWRGEELRSIWPIKHIFVCLLLSYFSAMSDSVSLHVMIWKQKPRPAVMRCLEICILSFPSLSLCRRLSPVPPFVYVSSTVIELRVNSLTSAHWKDDKKGIFCLCQCCLITKLKALWR